MNESTHECTNMTQRANCLRAPLLISAVYRRDTSWSYLRAIPDDLAPTSIQSILIDDVRDFVSRDRERGVTLVSALTNSKLKIARIAASDSVAGLVNDSQRAREPFDKIAELWATLLADADEEVSGIAEDHLAQAIESERISQVDVWDILRAVIKGKRPD